MISNTDNTIDSRDVIARIAELEELRRETLEKTQALSTLKLEACKAVSEFDASDEGQELTALKNLADQAEDSPDWEYGETLINESYFTDYIEELIADCYELPEELNSGDWPWRHITIDYEAAADEAKTDYMEVDFDGVTFLIRA